MKLDKSIFSKLIFSMVVNDSGYQFRRDIFEIFNLWPLCWPYYQIYFGLRVFSSIGGNFYPLGVRFTLPRIK